VSDPGGRAPDILIRGGTLVDAAGARPGDVMIVGERIAGVGAGLPDEGADVVDASGALVVPGGIDVHTHFDLPVGGVRSADDFETGTMAAACGGTTCVVDFAGAGRESPEEALAEWHAKASHRAVVDYAFHVTLTAVPEEDDRAQEMFRWLLGQGVSSVKLYMAYPDRLMVDDATLARALATGAATGVLVCVHAEDGMAVERAVAETFRDGRTDPLTHARVRPPEVEAEAVRRAGDLARAARAPIHIVHLSSAAGLEAVRAARSRGARIFVETCPQYLWLTEDRLAGPAETTQNFVCAPPLRTEQDTRALWDGLADGSIDLVATDHCPFTTADRREGVRGGGWSNFTEIPGGLPGVETRLGLIYQGVRDGRYSAERWVELCAGAPARVFGLSRSKGQLREGFDADVVVFDPEAHRSLDAGHLHMATDHSPYAGMDVTGWPALTFARGRLVAKGGDPADAEGGWGRFVPRSARQSG